MFSRKKSKILASSISEKFNGKVEDSRITFGGFTTCYYLVKFKYKDMRIEAYPYHPCCQIWIQNFRLPDNISFSVGSARPSLGLTLPLNDPFQNYSIPAFSNDAYNLEAAKTFCQLLENEKDIKKLKIGKKEYLIISSRQIVIHNRNRDLNIITDRINILKDLFERNNSK